jgi:hypothetical protein
VVDVKRCAAAIIGVEPPGKNGKIARQTNKAECHGNDLDAGIVGPCRKGRPEEESARSVPGGWGSP